MNVACDYAAPVQILNMEKTKQNKSREELFKFEYWVCDTCVWFYINVLKSFFQNSKA